MVGILIGVLFLLLVVVLVAVLAAGGVRLNKFALNTMSGWFIFIQEGTRIQTPNRYSLPSSRLPRKVNFVKIFTVFYLFMQGNT